MEIGSFGRHNLNPEKDNSFPTAIMTLSGYAAGLVHLSRQPWTHHVCIDLENDTLVLLKDLPQSGRAAGLYYHRWTIENGERVLATNGRYIKHNDNGPDTAEVELHASAYGNYYEGTFKLSGKWED